MTVLCFLQAHHITIILRNSVSDRVPFLMRVDTTNIPAKDFPKFYICPILMRVDNKV